MRTVTVIPASISRTTSAPIGSKVNRRVAAYARVSTDNDEQQTSYQAQVDYYTEFIKNREDWDFAGMYTDEGVTGTSTAKREGFRSMVADALGGKIDLIITKSVSRFARNTVDSLTTIRQLKEHGTEVYFEKENIWTFDSKGEMLLTILSSLSQEESRSISENVRWGQRKKMADGKFTLAYSRFLGYELNEDGEMVINEEEAKVVRLIYALYLEGYSTKKIAAILTESEHKTVTGNKRWHPSVIRSVLINEKYMGDALLMKTYTKDFLHKKRIPNNGEVQQYYVKGSHPAIIREETWQMVQEEMKKRRRTSTSGSSIFSSKIICGDCGSFYGSKVWHSNDPYRKIIWQCNNKFKNERRCKTPHVTEDQIKQAFIKVANRIFKDRDEVLANLRYGSEFITGTAELDAEAERLSGELQVIAEMVETAIDRNARVAQNQTEYQAEYESLAARFEETKAALEKVQDEISRKQVRRFKIENFIRAVENLPCLVTEFDAELWAAMVDKVTVYGKEDIRFTLPDGAEIRV